MDRPSGDGDEAGEDRRRAEEAGCRLRGLLGVSRHARVHAAEREGQAVVLKVRADPPDPVRRARFAREGRLGMTLHHPSLTRTLTYGPDWIVLGDLRGGDAGPARHLDHLLGAPPDPARDAQCRTAGFVGVAEALAVLHARGLVHRDVKPGNILQAHDGRLVLIDLGLLGLAGGDELGCDELVGSPAWMAPEQLVGAPPRPSADVWSFALSLACLLCGRPAFAGTADAVLRARLGAPTDEERELRALVHGLDTAAPASLTTLLQAGLSRDPEARPPITAFVRLLAVQNATGPAPA